MIYYFFSAFFCVLYLFTDRRSDIAADIHDIDTVAQVYLAIMCSLKMFHFFIGWSAVALYALEDVISLLRFKQIGYLFHFLGKPHAAADGVSLHAASFNASITNEL